MIQRKKREKRDNKKLWLELMKVITSKYLLSYTWQYKAKTDIFALLEKNYSKKQRTDFKSWAQGKKKKYFLNQGIDIFQAA